MIESERRDPTRAWAGIVIRFAAPLALVSVSLAMAIAFGVPREFGKAVNSVGSGPAYAYGTPQSTPVHTPRPAWKSAAATTGRPPAGGGFFAPGLSIESFRAELKPELDRLLADLGAADGAAFEVAPTDAGSCTSLDGGQYEDSSVWALPSLPRDRIDEIVEDGLTDPSWAKASDTKWLNLDTPTTLIVTPVEAGAEPPLDQAIGGHTVQYKTHCLPPGS